ncbi:MAG: S1-C subfamily serine protease [Alteromonas naphthalenivorans]|jgi:S1-C subfamily serine protease
MKHCSLKKAIVFCVILGAHGSLFSITDYFTSVLKRPHKTDTSWYDVQKRSEHAVVQVFSHLVEPNIVKPYRIESGEGCGSGFLISETGLILSNYHVVAGAMRVVIQMPLLFGKKMIEVQVKSVCPERDLALLELSEQDCALIKDIHGFVPFLPLGDSNKIESSDELLALGFPLGQEALKSVTGVVSGREHIAITTGSGRLVEARCIQVSTPINPGNSGGPTLNKQGEVVGVNTAGIGSAQNIGYALPISEFKLIQQDMLEQSVIRKPYLGARFCPAESDELAQFFGNPVPGGCYLTQVHDHGLLHALGLRAKDMMYTVNSYSVDVYGSVKIPGQDDRMSASDYISSLPLNSTITIAMYRQGEKYDLSGIVYCPQDPPVTWKYIPYDTIDYEIVGGMLLQDLSMNLVHFFRNQEVAQQLPAAADSLGGYMFDDAQREESALMITQVFPTSCAHKTRSIGMGDIITEINGQEVTCLQEARVALNLSKDRESTTFKTKDDNLIVLDTQKMLLDEDRLAQSFNYQITPQVQELLQAE